MQKITVLVKSLWLPKDSWKRVSSPEIFSPAITYLLESSLVDPVFFIVSSKSRNSDATIKIDIKTLRSVSKWNPSLYRTDVPLLLNAFVQTHFRGVCQARGYLPCLYSKLKGYASRIYDLYLFVSQICDSNRNVETPHHFFSYLSKRSG